MAIQEIAVGKNKLVSTGFYCIFLFPTFFEKYEVRDLSIAVFSLTDVTNETF